MSRSRKKNPVTTDNSCRKYWQRQANKRIRNTDVYEDIPDGARYRRYFDQYTICDYKFFWDPTPRVWFNPFKREWDIIDATPEWKARMK